MLRWPPLAYYIEELFIIHSYTWSSKQLIMKDVCLNTLHSYVASWLNACLWSIIDWFACTIFSSVTIRHSWMDPEEKHAVSTTCSIVSNHYCWMIFRPPIEWSCRLYIHICYMKSLVMYTLRHNRVCFRFLDIAHDNASRKLSSMNWILARLYRIIH